ncbi:5'-nucleotidase, lipoprotein e(P4) family [Riemerella columbipharyngis]|uniref:5'-nucleotidase, lipoprotein e(P4) family n=1 Tax=Riemerella columbipharyngis TaxID=1071918 RepID=A0A1G6ZKB4_9FLAO|nr:5'-nucleotidase, lipoprotein e(P4) family [Riemerella columbipharyngis]SDE02941.1 5'-nucleotidase, lipoprotein e(P4) family [Riemerella columbipharyngis]
MKKILFALEIAAVSYSLQSYAQVTKDDGQNLINATVWMQKSGEYKALAYQAYQIGQTRLADIITHDKTPKPKAVVLDIDETVLDNSPLEAYEILHNKEFSNEDWMKWSDLADAKPIPGALGFLNFAKRNGVTIFYITNRDEKERVKTLKNLQKYNYPFADNEHLILKSEKSSSKESRRQSVAEHYNIVLLFGDNLNDFSDIYYYNGEGKSASEMVNEDPGIFGKKFIILPNAMYGNWSTEMNKELKKKYPQRKFNSKEVKIQNLETFKD